GRLWRGRCARGGLSPSQRSQQNTHQPTLTHKSFPPGLVIQKVEIAKDQILAQERAVFFARRATRDDRVPHPVASERTVAAICMALSVLSGDNFCMSGSSAISSADLMRSEKRAAAGNSVLAAVVITVLKIVVGFSTGSLGILSEAAHSGLDLIASVLTFFSVRVSDKPADADHQYGHGKVENFSAFVETGLLLITCVWIIYEAVVRLFFRHIEIEPSIAAFAVMLFSMGVDWWRSRVLGRIASKYDSQALEADALHFSTDIWSAGVVVLGLLLVLIGRTYRIDGLRVSDPVAALFVAGVVVSVSWRLARRTVDAPLDAAPPGVRSKIYDAVLRVEGVLEVDRIRIRRAGNRYFADLAVGLARTVTFQRSGQLAASVSKA